MDTNKKDEVGNIGEEDEILKDKLDKVFQKLKKCHLSKCHHQHPFN